MKIFRKKLKRENSFCNSFKWNKVFKNKPNLKVRDLYTTNYKQ